VDRDRDSRGNPDPRGDPEPPLRELRGPRARGEAPPEAAPARAHRPTLPAGGRSAPSTRPGDPSGSSGRSWSPGLGLSSLDANPFTCVMVSGGGRGGSPWRRGPSPGENLSSLSPEDLKARLDRLVDILSSLLESNQFPYLYAIAFFLARGAPRPDLGNSPGGLALEARGHGEERHAEDDPASPEAGGGTPGGRDRDLGEVLRDDARRSRESGAREASRAARELLESTASARARGPSSSRAGPRPRRGSSSTRGPSPGKGRPAPERHRPSAGSLRASSSAPSSGSQTATSTSGRTSASPLTRCSARSGSQSSRSRGGSASTGRPSSSHPAKFHHFSRGRFLPTKPAGGETSASMASAPPRCPPCSGWRAVRSTLRRRGRREFPEGIARAPGPPAGKVRIVESLEEASRIERGRSPWRGSWARPGAHPPLRRRRGDGEGRPPRPLRHPRPGVGHPRRHRRRGGHGGPRQRRDGDGGRHGGPRHLVSRLTF